MSVEPTMSSQDGSWVDPAESPDPSGLFRAVQALGCLGLIGTTIWLGSALLGPNGWGARWGIAPAVSVTLVVAVSVVTLWCCLYLVFCAGRSRRVVHDMRRHPTPPGQYDAHGLGPLPSDSDGRQLYLDMVKRTLTNIPYEDVPSFFYDHHREPRLARAFSLERRVRGEDGPTMAHTMIGVRRLENLQMCIEDILGDGVPGDLIETGSYRGGATIFMRAVLKAHSVTDRRVIVCDTFVSPIRQGPPLVLRPLLAALASIPSPSWQRSLYMFAQRLPNPSPAFPRSENPSDDWINLVMWILRNPVVLATGAPNSLELVKSHFARYGLLDDQVVFLKGFFADTLPTAPLEALALIRLDGDTYESTLDALESLYDKLSVGGYCIVDDYRSFAECERAVEEFRDRHGITEEIVPIDNLAVFWKKSIAR